MTELSGNTTITTVDYGLAQDYKLEQYEICKERGHKANQFYTTNITVGICQFCGTHFWDEVTQQESNAPRAEVEHE